jgi:hypothetical protein
MGTHLVLLEEEVIRINHIRLNEPVRAVLVVPAVAVAVE